VTGSFELRAVEYLALSPDGRKLAVSSPDGRVAVLDPATGKPTAARDVPLGDGQHHVMGMGWTSDGQRLFVVSEDRRGAQLDIFSAAATPERSTSLPMPQVPVSVGMGLAFPGGNAEVYWYDLRQNGWVPYVREGLPDEDPRGLSWSLDGQRLVVASEHSVRIFEVPSGELQVQATIPCLFGAALSRDGRRLGVVTRGRAPGRWGGQACETTATQAEVERWDLGQTPQFLDSLGSGEAALGGGMVVIRRPDTGGELIDLSTGDVEGEIPPGHPGTAVDRRLRMVLGNGRCIAWSPDGRDFGGVWKGELVRARKQAGRWRFYDVDLTLPREAQRGLRRDRFFGSHEHHGSCWFDEHGEQWFATADRQWHLDIRGEVHWVRAPVHARSTSGHVAQQWRIEQAPWVPYHQAGPIELAVSPDGRWVATYGQGRVAYVWDARQLQPPSP
jgi:WD40 repeat protein